MPKVPGAFESGIGQAQSNNVPSAFQSGNTSADSFGASAGRALQRAGNVGLDFAVRIRDDEDKAQSYDRYSKSSEELREVLYNPDTGLFMRKGGEALGSYKEAMKNVDKIYQDGIKDLSGGAKERYDQLWRSKRESVLNSAARFEAQQRKQYKVSGIKATQQTSINDAIENYNNPEYVADSLAIGQAVILDGMEGQPAEAIKLAMDEYRSQVHTGVIGRFITENDALGAKDYYDKVKKDFVPKDRAVIEKLIKAGESRSAAQTAANQILRKNGDYDSQIEATKKIKDKDLRSEVVGLIDEDHTQNVKISEAERKQISSEAWDKVIESGSRHSIPTDQWVALDDETKTAIRQYTAGDPENIKTDPARWSELYTLYSQSPDKFKSLNLNNDIVNLSTSDFKDFTKKQQELINGNNSDQARTRTDLAIAKTRLKQIGIKTDGKLSKDQAAKNAMFFKALNQKKQLFMDENNRKPNEGEVEAMIDDLTVKLVFDDDITLLPFDFDTKKFAFELEGDEDLTLVEVPDDMREKILQGYYEAFGINAEPPSDDDIRKVYLRKVGAK